MSIPKEPKEIKNYLNISKTEWLITIDFTEKKL